MMTIFNLNVRHPTARKRIIILMLLVFFALC